MKFSFPRFHLLIFFLLSLVTQGEEIRVTPAQLRGHLADLHFNSEVIDAISKHLIDDDTKHQIEHLIGWAENKFPDLRNELGHWSLEAGTFQRGLSHSFDLLLSQLPEEERKQSYFELIDRLPYRPDLLRRSMEVWAYKYVSASSLGVKCFDLLDRDDPDMRLTGIRLGACAAATDNALFQQLERMMRTEHDEMVRYAFLATQLYSSRQDVDNRKIALLSLRYLQRESNIKIIDNAAKGLFYYIQRGALDSEDFGILLTALVSERHPWKMQQIGKSVIEYTVSSLPDYYVVKNPSMLEDFVHAYRSSKNPRKKETKVLIRVWSKWFKKNKDELTEKVIIKLSLKNRYDANQTVRTTLVNLRS